MSYPDYHFAERLMDLRVQEEQHLAMLSCLRREARRGHPSWASQQRCRLLCQLGRLLTSLGGRLLDAGLPEVYSREETAIPEVGLFE